MIGYFRFDELAESLPIHRNENTQLGKEEGVITVVRIEKVQEAGLDGIGYVEAERIRETVKKNIGYEVILQDDKTAKDRLEEIVDLLVETLCSTKPTICVSGDDYPSALVKEKLLKLNSMHIEYVFECLNRNTTYIHNIKKYLLATLFNAPSTIDSYYAALVSHDMHGDGSRGR
jgi:hypothetical protein